MRAVFPMIFASVQAVINEAWFVVKFFLFSRPVLLPWQPLSWVTGFRILVIIWFAGRAVELVRLYCTVCRLWLLSYSRNGAKVVNAQYLLLLKGLNNVNGVELVCGGSPRGDFLIFLCSFALICILRVTFAAIQSKSIGMYTLTLQVENQSILQSLKRICKVMDGVHIQTSKSAKSISKPNATTMKAINEVREGKTFKASSTDDLFKQILG